jgi:hypothetical protein
MARTLIWRCLGITKRERARGEFGFVGIGDRILTPVQIHVLDVPYGRDRDAGLAKPGSALVR